MNRRDLLSAASAAALVQGFSAACATAQPKPAIAPKGPKPGPAAPPAQASSDAEFAALAAATADCITAGEACIAHCIRHLAMGHKAMEACANAVTEMLSVCRATQALAARKSANTRAIAKLCADVCSACAEACKAHAKTHAECAACEAACTNVLAALKPFVA